MRPKSNDDSTAFARPKHPTAALILAAGLGTRLRPLTWKTPKPLMTVWGVPLIDHAIGLLHRWGVLEIAINTHWRADLLCRHVRDRWPGLLIRISREPEILGTGGALFPVREWIEKHDDFWVFNADVLASLDEAPLIRNHTRGQSLATLWLSADAGPRTVETDETGRITTFRSRRAGEPGTATFTGVHLVSRRIFNYLDRSIPSSIVTAYERALLAGERVDGVTLPNAYWADSGTPESVLALHRDVRRRDQERRPGGEFYQAGWEQHDESCVAPSARCETGAHVRQSVVGDHAHIAAGVRIHQCLVGAGVFVGHDATRAVLAHPSDFEDDRVRAAIAVLGWPEDQTTVEALESRGSDRAFFRLSHRATQAILVIHGALRPENDRYAGHAQALYAAGVPVPRVLAHSPEARWMVIEDLGTGDLLGRVRQHPASDWPSLYHRVFDTLFRLHGDATDTLRELPMEPAFGPDVYRWERELFAEHLLRKRLALPPARIAAITQEIERFNTPLHHAGTVVVHRDLQASNIFFHQDRACLIDFQGMRLGPAVYDMASLLCDPYVGLPHALRQSLLQTYGVQVPWGDETRRLFPHAAMQRLIQALGAFARLASFPGTRRFARHIVPAARMLLEETEGRRGLDELRRLARTLAAPGAPQDGEPPNAPTRAAP